MYIGDANLVKVCMLPSILRLSMSKDCWSSLDPLQNLVLIDIANLCDSAGLIEVFSKIAHSTFG
jgi:hypothetical protein